MKSLLLLTLLFGGALCNRVIKSGGGAKSAWIASFAKDPAEDGENDAIAYAVGTALPFVGRAPPFMFAGYAKGDKTSLPAAKLEDAAGLLSAKSVIHEKSAVLYVHWGVAEFCDADGVPGYQGDWPPKEPAFQTLLANFQAAGDTKVQKDTFLRAGVWSDTTFSDIVTKNNEDGSVSAEFHSSDAMHDPVWQADCRAGQDEAVVEGVTIGPYRLKCDFSIRPGPFWLDNEWKGKSNEVVADALAEKVGCGAANRKVALLAFLAGGSVGGIESASEKWQKLKLASGDFGWTKSFEVRDSADATFKQRMENGVLAQEKPLMDLLDVKSLPPFLKNTKAILYTFEAARSVLDTNTKYIFWDPALSPSGGEDPTTVDTGKPAVESDNSAVPGPSTSAASLVASVAVVLVAVFAAF